MCSDSGRVYIDFWCAVFKGISMQKNLQISSQKYVKTCFFGANFKLDLDQSPIKIDKTFPANICGSSWDLSIAHLSATFSAFPENLPGSLQWLNAELRIPKTHWTRSSKLQNSLNGSRSHRFPASQTFALSTVSILKSRLETKAGSMSFSSEGGGQWVWYVLIWAIVTEIWM